MTQRGGIAFGRTVNEVRYQLVNSLAEERIALASRRYDETAPEFSIDIVDKAALPGGGRLLDASGLPAVPEPYRGLLVDPALEAADVTTPEPSGAALIVEARVYRRRPSETEPTLVGRVHGILGYDFASAAKLADVVTDVIRGAMANP